MDESIKTPIVVANAIKESWLHIFVISNPVTVIVARMIIDAYKIRKDTVMIISMRNTDTSLIQGQNIELSEYKVDRYIRKLFRYSLQGARIVKQINKIKKKFVLYAPWAFLEVEHILNSKYCKGHAYLEEGQITYRPSEPYSFKSINFMNRIKMHYIKHAENRKDIYRDDADAFIGILPDAFPLISKEKRFILNNHEDLKKYYKPVLNGVKKIGLTCAERRLQSDQWENMLRKLVDKMPEGGVIKLHPSFAADFSKRNKIASILKQISHNKIKLCCDEVILEIEMLYEPKVLIGSLTSLSRYAKAFGSKFEKVNLY